MNFHAVVHAGVTLHRAFSRHYPMPVVTRVRLVSGAGDRAAYVGDAPPGLRTGWYLLVLRGPRQHEGWIASLRVRGGPAGAPAREFALVRPFALGLLGIKFGVFFVRADVIGLTARVYGALEHPGTIDVTYVPVSRLVAAAGLFWQSPGVFRRAWGSVSGTLRERVRKAVAAAGQHGQQVPRSYPNWLRLFDNWTAERAADVLAALAVADRVPIAVLVFHAGPPDAAGLVATLASVQDQVYGAAAVFVGGPRDGNAALCAADLPYVAVLQAGEVLPRHGLLVAATALHVLERPAILFADEDRIQPEGVRSDPLFKPMPSLTMLCSGLLSRGLWVIRSDLLRDVPGAAWAECVRLDAWFEARRLGQSDRAYRLPYVLASRRTDAENAPADALAETVNANLRRAGLPAEAAPGVPLRLQWRSDAVGHVSIIVPSRLRGETQISCLLDVLANTAHPDFDMLVVVTQDGPLDGVQEAAVRRLRADPRVRVELLRRGAFNYSAANNFGAASTHGATLCLLNDDISTLDADWLDRLVARFADPSVGVVGAKLYYPNLVTQHGGVIMGLAGLAEHASRFLPRGEPGYAWRGVLDQEMSVVTGACLLVRRELYERLGGLDESFPTAFNDVDFCLRVRALGYGVLFAGSVELVHHETLSFGHHYNHEREQEAADVLRMQRRWPEVCAADPFHNPNLSLAGGAEWELAYPPRVDPDCAVEIAKLRLAPSHRE